MSPPLWRGFTCAYFQSVGKTDVTKDALKIEHTGWAITPEESLRTEAGIPSGPEDWLVLRLENTSSHSSACMKESRNRWAHWAGRTCEGDDKVVFLDDTETKCLLNKEANWE